MPGNKWAALRNSKAGRIAEPASPDAVTPAPIAITQPIKRDLVARWQDELLLAIMECDAAALSTALDAHGNIALHAVLQRKEISRQGVFVLGGQAYVRHGALRDVLGGEFCFEDEEQRAAITAWLEMIGAQTGDNMLHLVMRLNGLDDDDDKVACAVQLMGRGCDWEQPNADGTLPPMIDPTNFKSVFLRALPRWREEQQAKKIFDAAAAAEAARVAIVRREQAEMRYAAAAQKEHWAKVKAMHEQQRTKEVERDHFHRRLNSALERLERRESRAAKGHDIVSDLGDNLRKLTVKADKWLKSVGL